MSIFILLVSAGVLFEGVFSLWVSLKVSFSWKLFTKTSCHISWNLALCHKLKNEMETEFCPENPGKSVVPTTTNCKDTALFSKTLFAQWWICDRQLLPRKRLLRSITIKVSQFKCWKYFYFDIVFNCLFWIVLFDFIRFEFIISFCSIMNL